MEETRRGEYWMDGCFGCMKAEGAASVCPFRWEEPGPCGKRGLPQAEEIGRGDNRTVAPSGKWRQRWKLVGAPSGKRRQIWKPVGAPSVRQMAAREELYSDIFKSFRQRTR